MNAIATPFAPRLRQAEFALLCVLLVVLPILEAPKNIALALFALVLVARLFVERKAPWRRLEPVEWSVIALVLAAAVSTAVNWPFPNEEKGIKDVVANSVVFLAIFRADYTAARRYLLAIMAVAGTVIGLAWGFVEVAQGKRWTVELHSVGVVTHSSLYVGAMLVMTVGVALFSGRREQAGADVRFSAGIRYAWWAAAAFMLFSLIAMASRGGILATGMALLLLLGLTRSKRLWLALGVLSLVSATVMVALPDVFQQGRFVEKLVYEIRNRKLHESEKERFANWRIAFAQITQGHTLLFGVGPRNFSGIDLGKLRFDPPVSPEIDELRRGDHGQKLNHAHNMFLNKLVEEGIFGLSALVAFFFFVARALFQDWRARRWQSWPWVASMGAFVVPVTSGTFGTPWYNEHALLGMIFFALYLSARRADNATA